MKNTRVLKLRREEQKEANRFVGRRARQTQHEQDFLNGKSDGRAFNRGRTYPKAEMRKRMEALRKHGNPAEVKRVERFMVKSQ